VFRNKKKLFLSENLEVGCLEKRYKNWKWR